MDRDSYRASFVEIDAKRDEIHEFKLSEPSFSQLPELEARLEREADDLSSLSPG